MVLTMTMMVHAEIHDRTTVMLTVDDPLAWEDPEVSEQVVATLLCSRRDDDLVLWEMKLEAGERGCAPDAAHPK